MARRKRKVPTLLMALMCAVVVAAAHTVGEVIQASYPQLQPPEQTQQK